MSETKQNDAPPKRCGHTFRDDIDCVRPLGHPNACVQKEAWCDKHCTYMHWTERDGKPWIFICLACVLESVQQLRCSIEAIDKKNLPQLIDNAFYRLDGLTTNVENIDRVLGGEKTCRLSESLMIATQQAITKATDETEARIRKDDAAIREGIAATHRELSSMITGKFAQVDTHIEATHRRIDDQSARIADLSKEFNRLNELHPIVVSNAAFVGKLQGYVTELTAQYSELVEVLDGKHGEDGCGMFKTYNTVLNDLRGELATLRKETQEDSAELRQMFAYRNVRAEKTWRERAREFIGLQLRELAFRLDGQP